MVEAKKDVETADPAPAPARAGGERARIGLFAVGLVLVAVGGAFLTAAVVFPAGKGAPAPAAPAPAAGEVTDGGAPSPFPARESYDLEEVVANILGSSGTRYVKIEVSLEISSPQDLKVQELIGKRRAQIRDRLITLFSGKSVEAIEGRENKDQIREEIREEVQRALFPDGKARVERVFFKNFLSQ